MKLGIYLYAVGTVAAGILDLIWGEFEPAHQPIQAWGNIPYVHVLAFLAAILLIASGAALFWRRTARTGAAASAAIYFIFAAFWLPRFVSATRVLGLHVAIVIGILGGVAQQAILVAAALLVYASFSRVGSLWPDRASVIARWTFALSSINFGIDHMNGISSVSAMVPKWMPLGGDFWAVFTGVAFILAGIAILLGVRDVLAARLLALMLLVFSVFALAPPVFARVHDHVAWGGNAYNLAAVGAVWIFAEWTAARRKQPESYGKTAAPVP